MAEPHDEGDIPELGDLANDLPQAYDGFEPISPGTNISIVFWKKGEFLFSKECLKGISPF